MQKQSNHEPSCERDFSLLQVIEKKTFSKTNHCYCTIGSCNYSKWSQNTFLNTVKPSVEQLTNAYFYKTMVIVENGFYSTFSRGK